MQKPFSSSDSIPVDLFTTTPQSVEFEGTSFLNEVRRISRQSEEYGYKGILVYSDNRLADPWTLAGVILAETEKLMPMIALQPVYMHPYTVAKKIATIGMLYNRSIALNLIAGGFVNDLKSLGDQTDHDKRYERLIEYTEIIQQLLTSDRPVTYKGEFYQITNLKLQPGLSVDLQPTYYLSGSSEKARLSAKRLGAKLIEYPEPVQAYEKSGPGRSSTIDGIRIGILVRKSKAEAWYSARNRFPETRAGELSHLLADKVSDSEWHKALSRRSNETSEESPVYWLGPFKHYHTFCPYLVGDYTDVAKELSSYLNAGCNTCILDIPVSETELQNTVEVFGLAHRQMVQLQ
ncbi:MAG: LLM class flavin-dependent oxidoreductase [Bacteroidota bacterium]